MSIDVSKLRVEGDPLHLSLAALAGSEIKDVHGYVVDPWGEPIFMVSKIALKNGREIWMEGEHGVPYVENSAETDHLNPQDLKTIFENLLTEKT